MNHQSMKAFRRRLVDFAEILGPRASIAELIVLLEVALREGERMTDLHGDLAIELTMGGVSQAVDVLSNGRGGWMERRDSVHDGREVEVWLTQRGRRRMEQIE